eukprot:2022603-Pleurochrysis_carterae.AAC.3
MPRRATETGELRVNWRSSVWQGQHARLVTRLLLRNYVGESNVNTQKKPRNLAANCALPRICQTRQARHSTKVAVPSLPSEEQSTLDKSHSAKNYSHIKLVVP